MNAFGYGITIRAIHVDGEDLFQATIKELPDIMELAATKEEAYELALDSINTTAQIFLEKNREMPAPQGDVESEFSGRVTLRLPKSLHARLAQDAEAEGVSLNQHIVAVLANHTGYMARARVQEGASFVGVRLGERAEVGAMVSSLAGRMSPAIVREQMVSIEVSQDGFKSNAVSAQVIQLRAAQ